MKTPKNGNKPPSGLPEWDEESSHNNHSSFSRGMLDREQYALQRAHERILCQECQQFRDEPCWYHVKYVPDCNRPTGPFAVSSLPTILYLDDLHSSTTGKIVRARETIFAQTVFGPLIATLSDVFHDTSTFACPDPDGTGMRYYQLESEEQSNWMRYVRFVENPAIANLTAYSRERQVVFVSTMLILPGEELTVCHSTKYARIIGRVPLEIKKEENDTSFFPVICNDFLSPNPVSPELQGLPELSTTADHSSAGYRSPDSIPSTSSLFPYEGHDKPAVRWKIIGMKFLFPQKPCELRPSSPDVEPAIRVLRSAARQRDPTVQTSPSAGLGDLLFQSIDDPDQDPDWIPDGCSDDDDEGSVMWHSPVKVSSRKREPSHGQIQGDPRTKHFKSMTETSSIVSGSHLNTVHSRADSPEIFGPSVNQNIVTVDAALESAGFMAENSSTISGNQLTTIVNRADSPQISGLDVIRNNGTVSAALKSAESEGSNSAHTQVVKKGGSCVCKECGKLFRNRAGLSCHKRLAGPCYEPITLGISPTPESQKIGLDYMMKTGCLSYYCAPCKVYFPKKNLLDLHDLSHQPVVTGSAGHGKECTECDFVGISLNHVVQHVAEHSTPSNGHKQCLLCSTRLLHLRWHYSDNHPEEWKIVQESFAYGCDQCGKRFFTNKSLERHLPGCLHQIYHCVCCDGQYENLKEFSRHIESHRTDGEFPCRHCSGRYKRYASLRSHCRSTHKTDYGYLEPKAHSFKEPYQAGMDYLKRTGNVSYFCESCRLHFPSLAVLDLHELSHTKEDYSARTERDCPLCDFVGSSFTDLINHTAQHGVEGNIHHAKSGKIQCLLCDHQAQNLAQHYQHMHSDVPVMEIRDSKVPFGRWKKMKNPFRNFVGRVFRCLYCSMQFRFSHDFGRHRRQHEVDGIYPCPSCSKGFQSYKMMRQHCRADHCADHEHLRPNPPRWQRPSKQAKSTESHRYQQHGIPPESQQRGLDYIRKTGFLSYYCAPCMVYFPKKSLLDLHTLTHQPVTGPVEQGKECSECDFVGASLNDSAQHAAEHSIPPNGHKQCLLCSVQLMHLRSHYRTNHLQEWEIVQQNFPYGCDNCGKRFFSSKSLDYHLNNCLIGRMYWCLYCSTQFSFSDEFSLHTRQHEVDGMYPCPSCSEVFQSYTQTRAHCRVEHYAEYDHLLPKQPELNESHRKAIEYIKKTGFMSYYCPSCRNSFPSEEILDLHILSHQKECPAGEERSCPGCDFSACTFADLVNHAAEHGTPCTGKKVTKQCLLCDYRSPRIRSHFRSVHAELHNEILKERIIRRSENLMFQCDQCLRKFKTKPNLHRHICPGQSLEQQSAGESMNSCRCLYCGAEYGALLDLLNHSQQHKVDSRYPCPSCWYNHEQYTNLKEHFVRCRSRQHVSLQSSDADAVIESPNETSGENVVASTSLIQNAVAPAEIRSARRTFGKLDTRTKTESSPSVHVPRSRGRPPLAVPPPPRKRERTAEQLHRHEMRNKRPVTCEQCGMVMQHKSWRKHMLWVHGGRKRQYPETPRNRMAFEEFPFKCEECHLGYLMEVMLKKHMRLKHPDSVVLT